MTARAARRPRIVRCPGCEKPLNDGQPVTQIDAKLQGWGTTSSGAHYRREYDGQIGWHASCLADWNAQNERHRAEALLAQDVDMVACFPGREDAAVKAMRNNGRTEDHIAAVLKAVEEGRKY